MAKIWQPPPPSRPPTAPKGLRQFFSLPTNIPTDVFLSLICLLELSVIDRAEKSGDYIFFHYHYCRIRHELILYPQIRKTTRKSREGATCGLPAGKNPDSISMKRKWYGTTLRNSVKNDLSYAIIMIRSFMHFTFSCTLHLALDQVFCSLHAIKSVHHLLHIGISPFIRNRALPFFECRKLLVSLFFRCSFA